MTSESMNDSENLADQLGREDDEDEFFVPPPPSTAFITNPDGSRLIITKIVNENFKSYAGRQELGPFHKYFTAIIGPNGSGKSNVIDSMLFVFGYRASRLRSKKLSALLHDSKDHGKASSCTVTVHFACMKDVPEDLDAFEIVPGSEFYVSRTCHSDNSSYYTINGKRAQFKEVSEKLKKYGIDLVHNRFLILQGEVEQISLMKPKAENEHDTGMLEYLEDIIGSSRFKEPIAKLTERVKEQCEIRDEKWHRCRKTSEELEIMRAPMEAALRYVQMENTIIILNSQLLQKKIAMGLLEQTKKAEMLAKCEEEMKSLKKELEEKRKEIQTLEKSNEEKNSELERVLAQKEKKKAEFEANKHRDVALKQEIERCNKKRKDIAKNLTTEEEKKITLQNLPAKNQQFIADLEVLEGKLEEERQAAEKKHAEVMASLQQDTISLQEEKETLQTEHAELLNTVNSAKAKYEVGSTELSLYTSRQDEEKRKLDDLNKRLEENVSGLESRVQEIEDITTEISEREQSLKQQQDESVKLKQEERKLDEERRKHQITVEESRSSMQSNRSRGKVLDALMQAKQNGDLPGVYGRMGDLGGIDAKYDVAISTAAGALDHIVVDNVDTAEACIMYLKRHNIGRASFVALDKQKHYEDVYSRPFKAPENVPRLFDLIKLADQRMKPAFYYALHDTLVASNLEQASRIAYGATRYRVVTEAGELIETAGTMSGGGNQVSRGRMGRKAEQATDGVSAKDMDRMERKLEEQTARLTELRRRIATLEDQISQNTVELGKGRQRLNKLTIEVKSCKSQEPQLRLQIQAQEKKFKEATPEPTKLAKLKKDVEAAKAELEKASKAAEVVEMKVKKVHEEIMAKTKGRIDAAQKKLDEVTNKLDKTRQEKTKLKVAVTTAGRNLKKCEDKITSLQKDLEQCVDRIKKGAAEIQAIEVDAAKNLEELEELEDALKDLKGSNKDYQAELENLVKTETALKSKQIDLKEDVSRAKGEVEARAARISADKKRLKSLKLTEEPYTTNQSQLKEYTAEELEALDVDEVLNDIKSKEETLPKTRPNLNAIHEFEKQRQLYVEREKDLEAATEARNKSRSMLEKMKQSRLQEFSLGFQVISHKVKECYQMLAEGGDAELEVVNTIDPFMDGIKFTVRPPKKSWKEIQFLSGGEKTLSSLSLIFALHYYKPTPLYFMDEIDSALDWKNVAIVGFYLKEQTKNAQFIVVSLRENMFEIADQLVGIYKTQNCTKSISIIPRNFAQTPELLQECLEPLMPPPLASIG